MKQFMINKILSILLISGLVLGNGPAFVHAQSLDELALPPVGERVATSEHYSPPSLRGIGLNPLKPLTFDFIIDHGQSSLNPDELHTESEKLIRYFLAALATPEKDMWVNLSPFEGDRIIPEQFGRTEMGRDLLAQDYILKQLAASLTYPEDKIGQHFWERVRQRADEAGVDFDVAIDTFNKVWIVPKGAVIYEAQNKAYIVESELTVLLEEDYLAIHKSEELGRIKAQNQHIADVREISSRVMREVVIPEIEREVNQGENFAQLRQVYQSLILATWYKNKVKNSLLNQIYSDRGRVAGVELADESINQEIYKQYVAAFEAGVYNYIKEDYDDNMQEVVPRKYFSGGFSAQDLTAKTQISNQEPDSAMLGRKDQRISIVNTTLTSKRRDLAVRLGALVLSVVPAEILSENMLSTLNPIQAAFAADTRLNRGYTKYSRDGRNIQMDSFDTSPVVNRSDIIRRVNNPAAFETPEAYRNYLNSLVILYNGPTSRTIRQIRSIDQEGIQAVALNISAEDLDARRQQAVENYQRLQQEFAAVDLDSLSADKVFILTNGAQDYVLVQNALQQVEFRVVGVRATQTAEQVNALRGEYRAVRSELAGLQLAQQFDFGGFYALDNILDRALRGLPTSPELEEGIGKYFPNKLKLLASTRPQKLSSYQRRLMETPEYNQDASAKAVEALRVINRLVEAVKANATALGSNILQTRWTTDNYIYIADSVSQQQQFASFGGFERVRTTFIQPGQENALITEPKSSVPTDRNRIEFQNGATFFVKEDAHVSPFQLTVDQLNMVITGPDRNAPRNQQVVQARRYRQQINRFFIAQTSLRTEQQRIADSLKEDLNTLGDSVQVIGLEGGRESIEILKTSKIKEVYEQIRSAVIAHDQLLGRTQQQSEFTIQQMAKLILGSVWYMYATDDPLLANIELVGIEDDVTKYVNFETYRELDTTYKRLQSLANLSPQFGRSFGQLRAVTTRMVLEGYVPQAGEVESIIEDARVGFSTPKMDADQSARELLNRIVPLVREIVDDVNQRNEAILTNLRSYADGDQNVLIIIGNAHKNLRSMLIKDQPGAKELPGFVSKKDEAMLGEDQNPGGIDFNPALIDMNIQGEGSTLDVPLPVEIINEINSLPLDGLIPTINQITPIPNLPAYLGATIDRADNQVSRLAQ